MVRAMALRRVPFLNRTQGPHVGRNPRSGYASPRFLILCRQVYAAPPAPQSPGESPNMPAAISLDECRALAFDAFSRAGVCHAQAEATADHITRAEARRLQEPRPLPSAGFPSPRYRAAARTRRQNRKSSMPHRGLVAVDGRRCLAPLSIARGRVLLAEKTRSQGTACMTVRNSLNFSALWPDIEPLAEQGFVAFTFVNSQSFVAPAGGTRRPVRHQPDGVRLPARRRPGADDFRPGVRGDSARRATDCGAGRS